MSTIWWSAQQLHYHHWIFQCARCDATIITPSIIMANKSSTIQPQLYKQTRWPGLVHFEQHTQCLVSIFMLKRMLAKKTKGLLSSSTEGILDVFVVHYVKTEMAHCWSCQWMYTVHVLTCILDCGLIWLSVVFCAQSFSVPKYWWITLLNDKLWAHVVDA